MKGWATFGIISCMYVLLNLINFFVMSKSIMISCFSEVHFPDFVFLCISCLHGVKGIRVISYSLGFPHVLSIYAPLWASIQLIHSPFLIRNMVTELLV